MKINQLPQLQRREFLRRSAQLSLAGVAAPWALNLAALGQAAAADASGGYKALVCVFLYGGNDYGATLLPYDPTGYNNLVALRGGAAGGGLVVPRESLAATALSPRVALTGSGAAGTQLAMAPQLAALKPLFDAGHLGWLLNVGTLVQPTTKAQYLAQSVPLPPKLFSHNDQQSVWQSSGAEGATRGWGGAIGDLFLSANTNSTFTCINATGNAVFMSGQQAVQYQVSNTGAVPVEAIQTNLFGSAPCAAALRKLITAPRSHWMEAELNRVTARSIAAEALVKSALPSTPPFRTVFDTSSSLARQLQVVARLIAARSTLGAQRQVFLVSLGGFDNHDFLTAQHPGLLTQVGNGLASFHAALSELGVADRACREAKRTHSDGLVVFEHNASHVEEMEAEMQLVAKLATGGEVDGLFLEMQPIMGLRDPYGALNFEVLLRMRDPDGARIPTPRLITAGEHSGRMSMIDRWVLRQTLAWLQRHRDQLVNTQFVSLNLSGASLNDERFIEDVFDMLEEYADVAPLVCLEITESVALHDLTNTRRFIQHVRHFGAKVALDDFGAGYTSFSYLKDLPGDLLKIDGSFIVSMNEHPANVAIVEAIVSLARNLGMKTIAEWAEDAATVETLAEIGVDYVQGFAIARALEPAVLLGEASSAGFARDREMREVIDRLQRQGSVPDLIVGGSRVFVAAVA